MLCYFFLIFKCDIPVVFYKFNMHSVQLAVKTQLIYCTVCTIIYLPNNPATIVTYKR